MAGVLEKRKSTLRDVARMAEVSTATVSRVLNGNALVSEGTRAKVQAAIDALHFVPSAAARAINSGRTHVVGALVPTLDHAIFSRFLDALEEELAGSGLSLVVATTKEDPDREAERARALVDIGVEGLIVSGVTRSADLDAFIEKRELPVVATSYFDPSYHLPTVGYDNERAARSALGLLLEGGHRDIAIYHGPSAGNDRTRARLKAFKKHPRVAFRFCEMPLDVSAASDAARRDFAEPCCRTTAVLALSDVLAQGALFGLQALGISVPREVSVVGIDDLPSSAATTPALTTVRLPVREMGRRAAIALAKWVEDGIRPAPERLDVSVMRASSSLAPASGALRGRGP
ncbi:MAG: LacI family transcriptional regulator [Boseongicola sp. SB0677_bin_26]|nr:LacI family transcriptional regulator [Boseongicola sp. SB0665_bin_10]MYG27584.1 LacI family transcriptional regulator [Boseongicola sp. SB0677_bin_26]